MSEKDKTELEVIDGGKTESKGKVKEKTTKPRTKKLTGVQLDNKAKEAREVKRINLTVGGEKYYFEIDTNPTTTRQADFVQNIKALTAYVSTEQAFDAFNDEDTSRFMASMILAEVMNVFSTLEVGDTIEEKVNFIAKLNDLNILQEVADSIPEGLQKAIKDAEEAVTVLVEELMSEADKIKKQVIDLEKLTIEENETKGE